jgi:hypothetical protein
MWRTDVGKKRQKYAARAIRARRVFFFKISSTKGGRALILISDKKDCVFQRSAMARFQGCHHALENLAQHFILKYSKLALLNSGIPELTKFLKIRFL